MRMNPPSFQYVIENVRLFDDEKCFPQPCSVHISDGIISCIGDYEKGKISIDNTTIVSGEGCTLLPGLIDAHTHVFRAIEGLSNVCQLEVTTI